MGMMMGTQTVRLDDPPKVMAFACSVGKKEGEGPLGEQFDAIHEDDTLGKENWEKAETHLFLDAV